MGFLEDLLEMTEELESPKSYWYWSGLTAISAVSKNYFLDRGGAYKLYPNIYVLLVGKSANRKGPPVKLAQNIVDETEITRVISGSNTIQAILKQASTVKTFPTGKQLADGSCFLVSDEQSNLINDDPIAQTMLTQLYDAGYHKSIEKETVGGGKLIIKNPYFVMLGATAQAHIPEYVQTRSMSGGFIGRTMIVYEENRACLNSLMTSPKIRINQEILATRLKKISLMGGEFKITPDGIKCYDDWYYPYNESLEAGTVVDDTGTAGRLGDHVLKVAMCLSLADKDELELDADTIETAIRTCVNFTTSVRRVTLQTAKTEVGLKIAVVIEELIKVGEKGITRAKLLQRRYGDLDHMDLDRAVETLNQSNIIDITFKDGETIYRLQDEKLAFFRGKLEEKLKRKK